MNVPLAYAERLADLIGRRNILSEYVGSLAYADSKRANLYADSLREIHQAIADMERTLIGCDHD